MSSKLSRVEAFFEKKGERWTEVDHAAAWLAVGPDSGVLRRLTDVYIALVHEIEDESDSPAAPADLENLRSLIGEARTATALDSGMEQIGGPDGFWSRVVRHYEGGRSVAGWQEHFTTITGTQLVFNATPREIRKRVLFAWLVADPGARARFKSTILRRLRGHRTPEDVTEMIATFCLADVDRVLEKYVPSEGLAWTYVWTAFRNRVSKEAKRIRSEERRAEKTDEIDDDKVTGPEPRRPPVTRSAGAVRAAAAAEFKEYLVIRDDHDDGEKRWRKVIALFYDFEPPPSLPQLVPSAIPALTLSGIPRKLPLHGICRPGAHLHARDGVSDVTARATWSSSNDKVATVFTDGSNENLERPWQFVTRSHKGHFALKAKLQEEGLSAEANIEVIPRMQWIAEILGLSDGNARLIKCEGMQRLKALCARVPVSIALPAEVGWGQTVQVTVTLNKPVLRDTAVTIGCEPERFVSNKMTRAIAVAGADVATLDLRFNGRQDGVSQMDLVRVATGRLNGTLYRTRATLTATLGETSVGQCLEVGGAPDGECVVALKSDKSVQLDETTVTIPSGKRTAAFTGLETGWASPIGIEDVPAAVESGTMMEVRVRFGCRVTASAAGQLLERTIEMNATTRQQLTAQVRVDGQTTLGSSTQRVPRSSPALKIKVPIAAVARDCDAELEAATESGAVVRGLRVQAAAGGSNSR